MNDVLTSDVAYMLGVVAVGFAVNYGLRVLPFLLFAGRDGELPTWAERLGIVVSPLIIAGLIVYSYSGLEWRTAYPYIAGTLTVGLHLWRRNPLLSIVAGTVLYMCLLNCGCATHRTLELDAQHPAVHVTTQGVLFGEESVKPHEVPQILRDYEVPQERVIHILLDPDVKDLRLARFLMACLSKAGYTRPVLVTKRHAESENLGKKKGASVSASPSRANSAAPAPRAIRYRKADE